MLPPNVIDIEASGLGCGSYAIEIGLVTDSGASHCALVKPPPGWTFWSAEAEELHGITRTNLIANGRNVVSTANWLNELLSGITVYSDGWSNDMCWIGKLFEEANIEQQFRVESILVLLNENEKESWTPIHKSVMCEGAFKRHRASLDAKNIQQTFLKVKKKSVCNDRNKALKTVNNSIWYKH